MNIAFAGFRHSHIFSLYNMAQKSENVNITGAFERDPQAKIDAEKNGVEFNYSSYNELLEDPKTDAVAIGDYYGIRGQMVIDALKHGKHIICDKPVCTNIDELSKIEALAKSTGLKVCCMLDLRYMPQIEKAKEIISNEKLGKINIVSFSGQHCLDFENRPKWYFEDGKHGGTINDIAIHGVDLLRYITSKNLTKINYAKTWNVYGKEAVKFKDCAQFSAEFEDMTVTADVSYAAPKCSDTLPTYWEFTLWGDLGMMRFNYKNNNLYVYTDKEEIINFNSSAPNYLNDFISEINGIKTGIMDTDDILKSQRQVLEIQKYADNI